MRKLTSSDSAGLANTSPPRRRVLRELILSLLSGAIVALVTASMLVSFQSSALLAVLAFYISGSLLIIQLLRRGFPHSQLGLGNLITLGRFVLVSVLFSVVFGLVNPWLIIILSQCLPWCLTASMGILPEGRKKSLNLALDLTWRLILHWLQFWH